jgi:hypothetical protein
MEDIFTGYGWTTGYEGWGSQQMGEPTHSREKTTIMERHRHPPALEIVNNIIINDNVDKADNHK